MSILKHNAHNTHPAAAIYMLRSTDSMIVYLLSTPQYVLLYILYTVTITLWVQRTQQQYSTVYHRAAESARREKRTVCMTLLQLHPQPLEFANTAGGCSARQQEKAVSYENF